MVQALTCYLWSQRREAFRWVFQEVIPELYGKEFCKRVTTFLADGDPQAADVIDDLIASGLYPNAKRKSCYYHLILQDLLAVFGSSEYMLQYVKVVREWCRRMAYVYETMEEADYAWGQLLRWVRETVPNTDGGFSAVKQPHRDSERERERETERERERERERQKNNQSKTATTTTPQQQQQQQQQQQLQQQLQ
jgi:hypothetical protein